MKSFEQLLKENCPAVFNLHHNLWEKGFAEAPKDIVEVTQEEQPVKVEWSTVHGKRVVDSSFVKDMCYGYDDTTY